MKAILFDLDGTLINTGEGITKSVQYALEYYGIKEDNYENLCKFIGPPLVGMFMKMYDFSKEQAQEALVKYRERYVPIGAYECEPYEGVGDCLLALKDKGYRLGVASSKPEELCRTILSNHKLIDLFDDVTGATTDGRITTKEEVLEEVFRRWVDVDRSQMCLIGDTIYDVNGAKDKGIPCIAVSFGFGDLKEMLEAGAVSYVDSYKELPDAIAKLED